MTDPRPPKRTNATARNRGARELNRYDAATKPQMPNQGNAVLHQAKSLAWPAGRQTRPGACCDTLPRGTAQTCRKQPQIDNPQSTRANYITPINGVMGCGVNCLRANSIPLLVPPFKNGGCHVGYADLMLGGEAKLDQLCGISHREAKSIRRLTKAYQQRLADRLRKGLLAWFQCGLCGAMRLDPAGSIDGRRPICFDCQSVAD